MNYEKVREGIVCLLVDYLSESFAWQVDDIETQGSEKIQIFVSFLVQAASTSRVVPLCAEELNFDYIFYGTDWHDSLNRGEPSSHWHFLLSLTHLMLVSYDYLDKPQDDQKPSKHAYVSSSLREPAQRRGDTPRILANRWQFRSTRRPFFQLFHGRQSWYIAIDTLLCSSLYTMSWVLAT